MITTLKTAKYTVTYNNGVVASVRDNATGRFVKVSLYIAETTQVEQVKQVNMGEIYAMWDRVGEKKRAEHRNAVNAMYERQKERETAKKSSNIWVKFKNLFTTPIAI